MNSGLTICREAHFQRGRRSRKMLCAGPAPEPLAEPGGRIPRLSRLMALAIRFDHLIRTGAVAGQADLARLGQVTRARVTQIMNLLLLAPDIQEDILFLEVPVHGDDPFPERQIRSLTNVPDWRKQRLLWKEVRRKVENLAGTSCESTT